MVSRMNRFASLPVVALLAASPAAAQSAASSVPLDAVVAVVGDQVITCYDVKERINQLIQGGMPA